MKIVDFILSKLEKMVKMLWVFAFLFMMPILSASLYIELFNEYGLRDINGFEFIYIISIAYIIHYVLYRILKLIKV